MQKAATLDRTDREGNDAPEARTQRIGAKIAALRRPMAFLRELQEPVEAADDGQVSLSGPDARSMATSGRGIGIVGYSVEIAVDPVDAPRIHATPRGGEGQHGGPAAMRHLACPMDQWAMRTGMRACSTICRVTPPSRNSRTRLWV